MLVNKHYQVIIPGSNLFCVGYLDKGTLRQDTWYSWRKAGEEVARSEKNILTIQFSFFLFQARDISANVEAGQGRQLDKYPRGSCLL